MLTATLIGRMLLPPKHTNGIDSSNGDVFTHVTFPVEVASFSHATKRWTKIILHLHLYNEMANQGFAHLKAGSHIAARATHVWPSHDEQADAFAMFINVDVSAIEPLDVTSHQAVQQRRRDVSLV